MKQAWAVTGFVVGALALAALIVAGPRLLGGHATDGMQPGVSAAVESPWQIGLLRNGDSTVMGLTLSATDKGSTLDTVQSLWGAGMQLAIVAAPGEDGSLEAFIDPIQAGFISGKAVVTARLPTRELRGMRARAIKSEFMESTTRKYTLAPADLATALRAPVAALSFIPQAQFDKATALARFGMPAQKVRVNAHAEHWLYPAKGLDLLLDSEGKELLQYVPPAQFDRLREPLAMPSTAASVQP